LVELHSGTVTAISQGPGKGSEFEVRLPLTKAQLPARESSSADDEAPAARKILVVDDNEDSTETMATLLTLWGHEVRTATDANHALRIAAEQCPDVVLLDIGLPQMSGYELAGHLRGLPGC